DGGIDSFKAPIIIIAPGLEAVLVNGYQFEVFDLDNMVDSIAPEQFTFMAHPEQKYGFDGVKKELLTEYKEEAGFVMPYKSVAFGEADKIRAVLTGDPPNDADVHFVELSTAAALKFTRSGNEYDIITGGLKSGLSQVIALGPNGIMGMFQVMGTAKEFVTVHLVPLNGYGKNTDAQSIEKAATDILRQAGFSVRLDLLDVGLQYDGAKISLENHFASAYSPDMKQIISQLGRKVNKEAHDVYMILTDKMEGNTTGFMPKGMGIGFMELGGGGQTIAHELCHGLFNMPHIFEGFYEGKTKGSLPDNLMDYNEGTALYYRQWARMQSPGVHLAWFDDAGKGKSVSNPDYFCINNEKADAFIGKCLMAYDGRPILLNEPLVQIAFYSNEEEIDSLKGRLASWRFKSDGFAYIPNLNANKEFEGYANTKGNKFNWVEAACSNPITVSTNRNLCTYTSSDQSIVGSDSYCKCIENEDEKGKYLNPIISYWGNDFEDKFNNTSALRNEKFENDRQEIVDMDIQSCFLCVRNKAAEIDLNSWVLQDRLSALFNHTGKQFTVLVNTLDYVIQQEEVDKLGVELYNRNFSGSNSTAFLFINLFKDRGYENALNPSEVRFLCQYKILDPSGILGEFTIGGSLGELIANLYKSITKPHYSATYKSLPNENFAIILSETNEWVRGYGEITSMEVWKYNVPAPVHFIGTDRPVEDPILHASEAFKAINDQSKFDIQKIDDLKDACAITYFQSNADSELKGKFLSYLEQWSHRGAAVPADCVFKELTATDAIVMPVLQAASYVPGIDIAASAVGYGIASYQGDVLYQEEFGAGLAMSVFFVDGKVIGEITERVVKGIVVNTAKKKYVNLAKQNVDEFAEFLVDGMNMAESRARRYAEKLHSKPRDQYEDYINQTVYERLGGARDELEFDWRLTLIFDDDGIFGKFIEKFGLEKADELWRFCNAKSYNESGLKEVFKYFGEINSSNGPEILTLFIGAKGRTAQLIESAFKGGTDAATGKVLLEDLGKGSREFVAFIDGRGDEGVGAWEKLLDEGVDPSIRGNIYALTDPDAAIDAIQTSQKTKPTWPEIQSLWKRGNDFNAKGRLEYEYNEINLVDGKRLDSYIPGEEIVSRKATTLSEIQVSTFEGYLKELTTKYKKGKIIRSNKYMDGPGAIDGHTLSGDYFLEIPSSNRGYYEASEELQALANKYDVQIKYLDE
ncbi:MAG: hypothetical protein KDC49_21690, partial [Saprospiraceae bacterium]|nr:hypothetical protein [Saprospiraceae bacterium]